MHHSAIRVSGGNGAEAVVDGFARLMKRLPVALPKGTTCERGAEIACNARRLKLLIRVCDPHVPWQRKADENTNGLLRQFMPKAPT